MQKSIQIRKLLESRTDKEDYFKFKEKHGYSLTTEEKAVLKEELIAWVMPFLDKVVSLEIVVITPQSSNNLFNEVITALQQKTGFKHLVLVKNDIETLKEKVLEQNMMKAEREKMVKHLEGIETLKVAQLAGNQRKRVEKCLFKPHYGIQEALIIDDSFMSGTTLRAIEYALPDLASYTAIAFYGFKQVPNAL